MIIHHHISMARLDGYHSAQSSLLNLSQTTPDATTHNISCDPKFAYDGNPNIVIYHLMNDSPCIDKGDPALSYASQTDLDNETRLMGYYVDMGADEIDPSCNTVYNSYDTNADGLVNLSEYLPLARAWLSHDPNDPAVKDPNNLLYQQYNDPNSLYYVSPTDKANWNPNCNYDDYGTSQYVIDLADLTTWIEDAQWLWKACWLNLQYMQQQNMMSMSMPAAESLVQSNTLKANPVLMDTAIVKVKTPKKSVQQQVTELEVAARWLEELWLTDLEARQTIDKKSWNEFMQSVYESLNELKTIKENQTLYETEVLQ